MYVTVCLTLTDAFIGGKIGKGGKVRSCEERMLFAQYLYNPGHHVNGLDFAADTLSLLATC